MRELVYLSEAKLSQFLPDRPPWWARLSRSAKVELSVPMAKVGLEVGEPPPDGVRSKLDAVIAEVERTAKWFDDPDVTSGEWVHFDLP